MTFDASSFGWGLGVVLAGWFAGMCVWLIMKTIGGIRP